MNKSQRETYKKLTQNGLGMRRIMKMPNKESKFPNNENERSNINIKNNTFKIHDRNVKSDSFPNPFDIPAHKTVFDKSKGSGQRKVSPIPFIMSEPKTICDIDENFYNEIEGRPIRRFDDIKLYMYNLRDIVLFKANAAFLKDQMLLTKTLNEFECNEYNKISSLYAETIRNFVRFLKQSFIKAKELESMAQLRSMEVDKIIDVLDGYSIDYIKLKNQVFNIMYTFEVLATYGRFLHTISPNSWRIEFDNLNSNINLNDITPPQQDSEFAILMSMASLDEFKAKAAKFSLMPSRIYFKEPMQVIKLFENISQQCLNYMTINITSSKLVKSCIKGRDRLKIAFKEDVDSMQDCLVTMNVELAYMEKRELVYKTAFEKLLYNDFKKLYAAHDNVKLCNCLQYTTSRIFGDFDDPKDTVSSLMLRIEQEYMDLSLAIDYLDLATVTKATKHMFAQDLMVMKQAHCAQRTLKECDILKKCLVASFEPPRPRNMIKTKMSRDNSKNDKEEVLKIVRKIKKV